MEEDSIFLFEYATCGAFLDLEPSITIEGLGMFKTLLDGFEYGDLRTKTFIDERIPLFPRYPKVKAHEELFDEYLNNADFSLIIAPETDLVLHNFIEKLEESDCANLGSSSKAVYKTSDKYQTYKDLRGVNTPKTELFNGNAKMDFPLVAKPRDGVSCEGIFFVKDEDDLEEVPKEGYILQEFVEGQACSASIVIGDEINILSINTQEMVDFVYRGAKIPLYIKDCEEIFKAIEKIRGLFGYVGVDFVHNDEISIIEINPRPTTPIIALNDVFGFNISELILKNYYGERIPNFEARKRVHLNKVKGPVADNFVSFQGYSIALEEMDEDIGS
ncbi:MAG: ATP-grasp domain-containing protein [Candidatus Hydrothermarchaeales archaeon]